MALSADRSLVADARPRRDERLDAARVLVREGHHARVLRIVGSPCRKVDAVSARALGSDQSLWNVDAHRVSAVRELGELEVLSRYVNGSSRFVPFLDACRVQIKTR